MKPGFVRSLVLVSTLSLAAPPAGAAQRNFLKRHCGVTASLYVKLRGEPLEARDVPSNYVNWRGDAGNTGVNPAVTALSPANVSQTTIGELASAAVDGQVYAQPLFVGNLDVTIGGATSLRNVAFVATENNSVYAIDADSGAVLWQRSLNVGRPGATVTAVPSADVMGVGQIDPQMGITSTPALDVEAGRMFVVAYTKEVTGGVAHYVYTAHAIDIRTGNVISSKVFGDAVPAGGTAVNIVTGPSVPGTGDHRADNRVVFDAIRQKQRPGLTFVDGKTAFLVAFAGHDDFSPSDSPTHGWILRFNATTLELEAVFCTTPNGDQGGIWQSGAPLVVDPITGDVLVNTGNGDTPSVTQVNGLPTSGNYGDSVIRLTSRLQPKGFYSPPGAAALNAADLDLGTGAITLLPLAYGSAEHPHVGVVVGKQGDIYLLDIDKLGGYSPTRDAALQVIPSGITNRPASGSAFTSMAFFNGTLYVGGLNQPLKAYALVPGQARFQSTTPIMVTSETYGYPGAAPVVSSNGPTNGLVWSVGSYPGDRTRTILRVYDANNLGVTRGTYTIAQPVVKFSVATVVDSSLNGNPRGLVILGGGGRVSILGVTSDPAAAAPAPPTARTAVSIADSGNGVVGLYDGAGNPMLFTKPFPDWNGSVRAVLATQNGVPYAVMAAGEGGGPVVKIVRLSDNVVVKQFFAYDRDFRGGVNLAIAQLPNGDFRIVTGAGPGGGPQVNVYTSRGDLITSFMAYDASLRSGVYVAAGDVLGKGTPQIVTGAGSGGPHVKVWELPPTGAPTAPSVSFYAFELAYTGGVTVAVGDVRGLGRPDLIVGAASGSTRVSLFSLTLRPNVGYEQREVYSFFAYQPTDPFGVDVSTGVPTDGTRQVVLFTSPVRRRNGSDVREWKWRNGELELQLEFDPLGGVYVDPIPVRATGFQNPPS